MPGRASPCRFGSCRTASLTKTVEAFWRRPFRLLVGYPIRDDTILFVLAALASAAVLLWAVRSPLFAGAFLAGLIGAGGLLLLLRPKAAAQEAAASDDRPDVALLRQALDGSGIGSPSSLSP